MKVPEFISILLYFKFTVSNVKKGTSAKRCTNKPSTILTVKTEQPAAFEHRPITSLTEIKSKDMSPLQWALLPLRVEKSMPADVINKHLNDGQVMDLIPARVPQRNKMLAAIQTAIDNRMPQSRDDQVADLNKTVDLAPKRNAMANEFNVVEGRITRLMQKRINNADIEKQTTGSDYIQVMATSGAGTSKRSRQAAQKP